VARSYDEKLMIFFDTHFKSNSSSIRKCGGFAGH